MIKFTYHYNRLDLLNPSLYACIGTTSIVRYYNYGYDNGYKITKRGIIIQLRIICITVSLFVVPIKIKSEI